MTHVQGIRDLQLAPPVPKASASKQCLRSTPTVIYVPVSEGFWEGSRQEHEPSALGPEEPRMASVILLTSTAPAPSKSFLFWLQPAEKNT